MRNDTKRSVTGPEGSFPNPGEGILITEITFEANVNPEDRFPGYGLYKVFLASLEYCLIFWLSNLAYQGALHRGER